MTKTIAVRISIRHEGHRTLHSFTAEIGARRVESPLSFDTRVGMCSYLADVIAELLEEPTSTSETWRELPAIESEAP